MLTDLVEALGGEALTDVPTRSQQRDNDTVDATYDPGVEILTHDSEIHDQAVTIVLARRRFYLVGAAHLRISNRAARSL